MLPVVAAIGLAAPVKAQSTDAPGRANDSLADRSSSAQVTLITGDKVTVYAVGEGHTAIEVEPAPRPTGLVPQFHVSTHDGQTRVMPSDMTTLVPEVVDPELFNVTALIDQGLADGASSTIPLIVDYSAAAVSAQVSDGLPAMRAMRRLDSIDAVAGEAAKADVAELAAAIVKLAAAGRPGRAGAAARTDAGPLAGIDRIWLDRRVQVTLDRSTGQIAAPAAWAEGYDGTGVTVAVLDTGIDDTHPDLADQVVAAQDFTEDGTTRDLFGHGTHVASIVAGTGAASNGARRGVAEGADLLNGKVLDATGWGFVSWIIAGMEWAAADQDADIINMSLGLSPGQFEGPLLTEAVETLSAAHGALFVVAAGNMGCDECIGAPADAPRALTVGAVDREDQLADFSSRGPVPGTFGLKPDITAPGVGILAARATDGQLGGEGPYLELSGTSMATPHVAGAAALLAHAHPEFSAEELKGALMSAAVPTDGLGILDQGTGRVDIGQALTRPIFADPASVDFGAHRQGTDDRQTKTLTYHNVGDQPVTLDLSLSLDDGRGGSPMVSVTPSQLTVQPGATASAEVAVDVAGSSPGQYTGYLVAQLSDGSQVRSPVGIAVEPEHFDVTVTGIARDGRPALPFTNTGIFIFDVETGEPVHEPCVDQPRVGYCFSVPAGTYSVMAFVNTFPAWAPSDVPWVTVPLHTALVGNPELSVQQDTDVVLDARDAVEITVDTPAHSDAKANPGGASNLKWSRTWANGTTSTDALWNYPGAQVDERLFLQPMAPVSVGEFSAESRWRLEAPAIEFMVVGSDLELNPTYYRMDWFSDNSWQFPSIEGTLQLPVVDAGEAQPSDIDAADLDGALALIRRSDEMSVAEQSNRAAAAGARMVAIYNDLPGSNADPGPSGLGLEVPTVRLSHEEGAALLDLLDAGPVTVTAAGTMASPYVYDLVYTERAGVPDELHYTADPASLVRLDRAFHSHVQDEITYTEGSAAFQPTDIAVVVSNFPLQGAPRSRVDYHASDPMIRWTYNVSSPEEPYNFMWPQPETGRLRLSSPLTTYAPGEHRSLSWLEQTLAPGLNPSLPVGRYEDLLVLGNPFGSEAVGLVDSDQNFASVSTSPTSDGFVTSFRVLRGDDVLYETNDRPSGFDNAVPLPTGEPETYRMVFEVDNNSSWARLSTRTHTEWTFRSERTAPQTLEPAALLTVDYDLDVDLRNRIRLPAERRGANIISLTVGHQAGVEIPVADAAVAVSYDDGRTWRDLTVQQLGNGRYSVTLGAVGPRGTGFLSLRLVAKDVDGNRIEQEIIRAAALPPVVGSGITP